MKLHHLAVPAALAAAIFACSSDRPPNASDDTGSHVSGGTSSSSGTVPTDGGGSDAGAGGDADAAAPACVGPDYGGATVTARVSTSTVPVDLGGTLTPGTYDLTGYELYVDNPDPENGGGDDDGGTDAAAPSNVSSTARGTFVLTDTAFESSLTLTDGTAPAIESAVQATYTLLDAELVLTELCPVTDTVHTGFTATDTTITLHSDTHRRLIYTRRP